MLRCVLAMNDVQQKIQSLRDRGWTLVAISRELEVSWRAVAFWQSGDRYPANAKGVRRLLVDLLIQTERRREKSARRAR